MTADATPNPFDPEQYRIPQDYFSDAVLSEVLTTIPVRKPKKQEFVRSHPDMDYSLRAFLIEVEADREAYLVVPAVAKDIPEEVSPVLLVLSVNKDNEPFLWPVKLPKEGRAPMGWHESAKVAADIARECWVRVTAGKDSYKVTKASAEYGDPIWPTESFASVLELAFAGRVIASTDHEVLKRLRGEI